MHDDRSGESGLRRLRLPTYGTLLIPLALSTAIFTALNSEFFTSANLIVIVGAAAFVGIAAVGETILLIAGEIDLSVGAVAGLVSIISGEVMVHTGSMVLGVIAGLLAGFAVGLVNTALVLLLRIPSFIATIAMLYIASGLATYVTQGQPIYPLPGSLTAFGLWSPLGLPSVAVVFVLVLLCGHFVLTSTTVGRWIYAVGGNSEVSEMTGIPVRKIKMLAFVLCSVSAGLAGIVQMASLQTASNQIGSDWELQTIAAVVIGGTSIYGGTGSLLGTGLGVVLIAAVNDGLATVGVPSSWETLTIGVILICSIGADYLRRAIARRARIRVDVSVN
jgi:ribose transport system permease protein